MLCSVPPRKGAPGVTHQTIIHLWTNLLDHDLSAFAEPPQWPQNLRVALESRFNVYCQNDQLRMFDVYFQNVQLRMFDVYCQVGHLK